MIASVAMAKAPPATGKTQPLDPGTTRVAVIPMSVEGVMPPAWKDHLMQALVTGLRVGEVELIMVDPSEHDGAAPCDDASCFEAIAVSAKARYLVHAQVTVEQRNYLVKLQVLQLNGQALASDDGRCEMCGLEEVADMVSKQATVLTQKLDRWADRRSMVSIASTPSEATVLIDGEVVGTTPLEYEVTPGKHQAQLRKPGYSPQTREIEVVQGVWEAVGFTLQPQPITGPTEPTGPRFKHDWQRRGRVAGWSLIGAGAGVFVAGMTFLLLDEKPYRSRCSGTDVDAVGNCRFQYNTLTHGVGMTIGGGLLAIAGMNLVLVVKKQLAQRNAGRQDRAFARRSPRAAARGASLRLRLAPHGATLAGRF